MSSCDVNIDVNNNYTTLNSIYSYNKNNATNIANDKSVNNDHQYKMHSPIATNNNHTNYLSINNNKNNLLFDNECSVHNIKTNNNGSKTILHAQHKNIPVKYDGSYGSDGTKVTNYFNDRHSSSSSSTLPLLTSGILLNRNNTRDYASNTTINSTKDLEDLLDDLFSTKLPTSSTNLEKIKERNYVEIPKLRHSYECPSNKYSTDYNNNNYNTINSNINNNISDISLNNNNNFIVNNNNNHNVYKHNSTSNSDNNINHNNNDVSKNTCKIILPPDEKDHRTLTTSDDIQHYVFNQTSEQRHQKWQDENNSMDIINSYCYDDNFKKQPFTQQPQQNHEDESHYDSLSNYQQYNQNINQLLQPHPTQPLQHNEQQLQQLFDQHPKQQQQQQIQNYKKAESSLDGIYDTLDDFKPVEKQEFIVNNQRVYYQQRQQPQMQQVYPQQHQIREQHQEETQKVNDEGIYDNFDLCLNNQNNSSNNQQTSNQQHWPQLIQSQQQQQPLQHQLMQQQQQQKENLVQQHQQNQNQQPRHQTQQTFLQQEQQQQQQHYHQQQQKPSEPISIDQHPRQVVLSNIQSRELDYNNNIKKESNAKNNGFINIEGNYSNGHGSNITSYVTDINGNITKDNDNIGNSVKQVEKTCASCNGAITGEVLMALDKFWHLDHFRCHHCQAKLGMDVFYEKDEFPYCEKDYIQLFFPKCPTCKDPVLEDCIVAMNQVWHPGHFSCFHCGVQFKGRNKMQNVSKENGNIVGGDDVYHEMDGKPYCSKDFFALFAMKCFGCEGAIMGSYITALNQQWHDNCFVCSDCRTPFTSGSFYDVNSLPFCEKHFNVTRGGICFTCKQPITGPLVIALNKRFHPGHFVCTFCLQPLNRGTFKETNNKPYCLFCSKKLFF